MKVFAAIVLFIISGLNVNSQDMSRVKAVIDTLCSPDYHGRGYVKEGDKKAADFISSQFAGIGLEKAVGNSFFQPFSFSINTFPGKLSLKIEKRELIPGKDFIVAANSPPSKFKGKALYLDTLIFHDSSAQKTFLRQRCGKEFLIYRAEDLPKIANSSSDIKSKFNSFKGYIEVHSTKLTASVSTDQSLKPIIQILKESMPSVSKRVEFNLEAEFFENYISNNVIGFIPGRLQPDSFIVFTAHYDHLGRMGSNIYFPGANDNASGVSMLLELAHFYHENSEQNKYSTLFIAFSGEEAGLLGSRFYVSNPVFPMDKIKFLVNMDLVGTGDDGIAVVNGSIYEREFLILDKINVNNQYFSLVKKRGEAANSDHYFFHKRRVKSFFIYTLGGTRAYHDIYDVPKNLPLTKYEQLFKLLVEFISSI